MKRRQASGSGRSKAKATVQPSGQCITCGQAGLGDGRSFAFLSVGALWMSANGADGVPHSRMRGFLGIGWHGAHRGARAEGADQWRRVELVESANDGQAELLFCSTACMKESPEGTGIFLRN
jgi:hypothetical protein